uniref:Myosin-11-like n=1 Tax=Crassostrea virginica TaxID=6565 RepID=A0A8B8CXV5_CRAVI|nr:myosin-11-like [Crassostrea virginica]XP_022320646.1 myosin-11-like [Crassostrea virginica]
MPDIFFFLWWIVLQAVTLQVSSMTNSIGQDCVVSLTIPMDKIKSSCNTDERTLRKMQALEAKLERMYTSVRGFEVRMPQVTNHLNGNQETMKRLEFNLAQSATYVKRLEDRVLDLEAKLSQIEKGDYTVSQRDNSLDSLLDPVRPMVMHEMERFKQEWMKNMAENIVPAILNSENKLGVAFKDKLIQTLRTHIKMSNVRPSEIVESSSEIEDFNNSTNEEDFETEFMVVSKPTKVLETSSESPWDSRALDMLARTLKTVSLVSNDTIPENVTSDEKGTLTSSFDHHEESLMKLLTFVKSQVSKEVNERLSEIDFKIQNISDIFQTRSEMLGNNISNYQEMENNQRNSMERNISDIRGGLSLLETKFQQGLTSLPKTIENHTKSKLSSLETIFSQKLQQAISRIDSDIYTQNRRVNISANLVKIFQETLAKYQNQSRTEINQLQQKVADLSLAMKATAKDDSDVMKERLRYLEEEIQAVSDSQLFMEQGIDKLKTSFTNSYQNAQNEIRNLNRQLQDVEFEVLGIDQLKVSMGTQDIALNNTVEKVNSFEIKLNNIQKTFSDFTVEVMSEDQWVPFNFTNSFFRNDCEGGKKLIRKSFFGASVVKFVGVQLCSKSRYKIFLGTSKGGMFYDIGDKAGRGEDHCQFVGAIDPDNSIKAAYIVDKKLTFSTTQGYIRAHWNEEPQFGSISLLQPTPAFYECGVMIP